MRSKQWVLFSLFILMAVSAVEAQDSLKCESNDGRRNYCGNYNPNEITLDRQISDAACIAGRTWGVDRQGLWVDRGCRAYFRVDRFQGGRPGYDRDGWWDREPNAPWPPRGNWHGGRWEQGGACFYKDRNFGGSYFCMRRGEQRASLAGYGDDISSIRIFGNARVIVFDGRDFRGPNAGFRRDISDLRQRGVVQRSDRTWNNRISSLQIQ